MYCNTQQLTNTFFIQSQTLGWHFETDTNVCLVQYKYLKDIKQAAFKLKNTVDNRLQIVAQQASEFIRKLMKENIVQSLENVVMVGYCFGAYIAAYTGRHLKSATNQLVKALFGELRSVKLSIFFKKDWTAQLNVNSSTIDSAAELSISC